MCISVFLSIFVCDQAFKKARSMGLGDLDFSAVHETVTSIAKGPHDSTT